MKKKTAVVFGLTINHIAAVACVMMDLKAKSPDLVDEVVIFCDKNPKKKDIQILNTILPVRIIIYDFPVKDISQFNPELLSHFSKMLFTKFECLRLLDEYRNVIWLDYDLIVQKDISELADYCEQGIKLEALLTQKVSVQFLEPIEEYDMNRHCTGLSTFVVQDNLRDYIKLYKFCYSATVKYASKLYLMEQGIFDIMLQEFNLDYYPLKEEDYCPNRNNGIEISNAKIFHAYGFPKYWNGLHNESWDNNYKNWLDMGGSKISDNRRSIIEKILVKILPNKVKEIMMKS